MMNDTNTTNMTREQIVNELRKAERATEAARLNAMAASFRGSEESARALSAWEDAEEYETKLRGMLR